MVESSTLKECGREKVRITLHPKCRSERRTVTSFPSIHFSFPWFFFFNVFFSFLMLEKKKMPSSFSFFFLFLFEAKKAIT